MEKCKDCVYLKEIIVSSQCSTLECVRPDKTGNYKGSADVGACEQFKRKG